MRQFMAPDVCAAPSPKGEPAKPWHAVCFAAILLAPLWLAAVA